MVGCSPDLSSDTPGLSSNSPDLSSYALGLFSDPEKVRDSQSKML